MRKPYWQNLFTDSEPMGSPFGGGWVHTVTEVSPVPHGESPTVGRLILGIRLRELRQREGVSAEDAAEHITRATSAISRFETGQTAVPGTVLSKLLKLYKATEEEREALTTLGKRA